MSSLFNTNTREITNQKEFDEDINRRLRSVAVDPVLSKFIPGLTCLHWVFDIEGTEAGPTACTDGFTVWVNRDYWNLNNEAEQIGLMFHEMLHPMWLHFYRFRGCVQFIVNVATDIVVNGYVQELAKVSNKILLPANPPEGEIITTDEFGQDSEEVIYNELARRYDKERKPPGDNPGDQPGGPGDQPGKKRKGKSKIGRISDLEDYEGPGGFKAPKKTGSSEEEEEKMHKLKDQWEKTAHKVAQTARMSGDFPGHLVESLDKVDPGINLGQVIQNFVMSCTTPEISEENFDRRHMQDDLYVEDISVPAVEDIIFVTDTSASMLTHWLAMAKSGIQLAMDSIKIKRLWVLDIDTDIDDKEGVSEFTSGDTIDFTALGRGGTDFRPPFEWAKKHCPTTPKLLIYFTDGWGPFPEEQPAFPTLFLTFGLDPEEYPSWSQVIDMRQYAGQ